MDAISCRGIAEIDRTEVIIHAVVFIFGCEFALTAFCVAGICSTQISIVAVFIGFDTLSCAWLAGIDSTSPAGVVADRQLILAPFKFVTRICGACVVVVTGDGKARAFASRFIAAVLGACVAIVTGFEVEAAEANKLVA